jgi:hypothetical protein
VTTNSQSYESCVAGLCDLIEQNGVCDTRRSREQITLTRQGESKPMPKVIVQDVLTAKTTNVQVTHSASPKNSRSESVVVVNPTNPLHMVGASKKFLNPEIYDFTLATYYSLDGGHSWAESAPLRLINDKWGRPWGGISDPALTFDSAGNLFLVALPFAPNDGSAHSIAIYKSSDGGRTWGDPQVIHVGSDDKQWAGADLNPASPFFGNVYAVWSDGSSMRFARTSDHGVTWRGTGASSINNTLLAQDSFSPEISVAADGTIYIVYWNRPSRQGPKRVKFVKSVDGGETFTSPQVLAEGITDLEEVLPHAYGWAHFPTNTFRVLTMATGCIGKNGELLVAWADGRQLVGVSDVSSGSHVSRIYYRRSLDGGNTWEGPESGRPLLSASQIDDYWGHHFHPQLISMPEGRIGCAFYALGWREGYGYMIDVKLAVSLDGGATFPMMKTVTNRSWDPAIGAPLAHGKEDLTFIGEYFGLDGSSEGFTLLWTDTRTGMQELFAATLDVEREYHIDAEIGGAIFGGVAEGGNGILILPGGRIKKVPPHEPVMDIASFIDIYCSASAIENQEERVRIQRDALKSIKRLAQRALDQ